MMLLIIATEAIKEARSNKKNKTKEDVKRELLNSVAETDDEGDLNLDEADVTA